MSDTERAPSTEEKVTDLEQYEGQPELSPPTYDGDKCDDDTAQRR